MSYIRATPRHECRQPSQVAYRLVPCSRTAGAPTAGAPTAGAPAARRAASDDPERMRGSARPAESSPGRAGSSPPRLRPVIRWPCLNGPQQGGVRSTDISPKVCTIPATTPLQCAATRRREVVSWPLIPAPGCDVRMADITAKSQLGMAALLALDTYLRNGHASDQAQVTVLRTLVRYTATPTGDAYRRRVEVLMTAPPPGPAAARTAIAS